MYYLCIVKQRKKNNIVKESMKPAYVVEMEKMNKLAEEYADKRFKRCTADWCVCWQSFMDGYKNGKL